MVNDQFSGSTPQFDTAEYSGQAAQCRSCKQTVAGSYYRVNGMVACPRCLEALKRRLPRDTHQTYVRALLFGGGAAVLGLVLYAVFGIITGLMIGYVSLAVGYLVGKAMKLGSQGAGGRRYQIAAAALTYAAVSIAAVPISIVQLSKHQPARFAQSRSDRAPSSAESGAGSTAVSEAPAPEGGTPDDPRARSTRSVAATVGTLALLGLASPFLELQDPVRGLIGLLILFIGIRIAWRMTAGPLLRITGPFSVPTAGMGFPAAARETNAG